MRTTVLGDAARIELLLAELRLPAIKLVWASLAAQADKEAGRPDASWQHWPNTRLPSAVDAGSNATSPKPGCRPARPSTASTSRPSRNQQKKKKKKHPPSGQAPPPTAK